MSIACPAPYTAPNKALCEIDLFRPSDYDRVIQLFKSVYGENYPIKTFYNSILLIEANRSREVVTVVASNSAGADVGVHNLLYAAN